MDGKMSYNNTDKYHREHTYLRVSLTNKCNLSCLYCRPYSNYVSEDSRAIVKSQSLSGDIILGARFILDFIAVSVEFGVSKIRFTGGEPLLRDDIWEIIEATKRIKGIEEVCITTNGILLKESITEVKKAGLSSINISLDSLNKQRYKKITGSNSLDDVIEGIYRSIACGIKTKINTVVLDDLTVEEADEFVKFAIKNSIATRFIELMPVSNGFYNTHVCVDKVREFILEKYKPLYLGREGVAENYKIDSGTIGFILPVSSPFCHECNRLRLSSNGILYRCLFDTEGFDVKYFLQRGDKELLLKNMEKFLMKKKLSPFLRYDRHVPVISSMCAIGG